MARMSVVLCMVFVAFLAIQLTEGQGPGSSCTFDNKCSSTNCIKPAVACCDGLEYSEANNGTVSTKKAGRCTCCSKVCRTDEAWSFSTTPNTQDDATACSVSCVPR